MAKRKQDSDIHWYEPNKKGTRWKVMAKSTTACRDLIAVLYQQYGDMRLVYENIHYDRERKSLVKKFIDKGWYTGFVFHEI